MLSRLAVVVPAHNEQDDLGACLDALDAAAPAAASVRVYVVLDSCTDGSARIAEQANVQTVTVSCRNVGAARAAGVAAALGDGPDGLWIATTDADSQVPADWLTGHLRHASAGVDVLVGTVAVADWTNWPDHLPPAYLSRYASHCGLSTHSHVHGANLGFTGAAYLAAGGFPSRQVGEDWAFVETAKAIGLNVVHATDVAVTTSARRVSRVDEGFAGFLRDLAGSLPNQAG